MSSRDTIMIPPTIITIFGATGDLSTKKLIPSLFNLFTRGFLPKRFHILGTSRRELSSDEYRQFAKESIESKGPILVSRERLEEFLSNISYIQGSFDDFESYQHLGEALVVEESRLGQCASKLFYLAVPPIYYKTIFENLARSGIATSCSDETGWTRILVEKPFGNDAVTARELDDMLGNLFKEEQIFRIDHYLAKESLQDILMFRFSNMLLEPLWSNAYIERIEISLLEKGDVQNRGAFYDAVGALRDVGQNHMLQMLTFIAMEDPVVLDAVQIRKSRAEVLRALRPITSGTENIALIRGQYEGYGDIASVAKGSETETYFRMEVAVDNPRWRGVPFVLESGKALNEEKTEIKVYFKKTESCLCPSGAEHHHQNILTFRIQPNEGISILFWAKKPGLTPELEPKELSFSYRQSADGAQLVDAYEKVLFDGIAGDQMLFTSTEEVVASWQFITPILDVMKNISLRSYKKGSHGPEKTHV